MITKSRLEGLVHHFCDEQGITRYDIEYTKAKSFMGQCRYVSQVYNYDGSYNSLRSRVTFRFSLFWMEHAPLEEMLDTILHEIAHALAGPRARHGAEWKSAARLVGCKPKASANFEKEYNKDEHHKWRGTCPNGHTTYCDRLTERGRSKSCGRCSSVYNPAYKYIWEQLR